MHPSHFRTGSAWRTNLGEAPILPEPEADRPLSRTEIMSLLEVRGGGLDSLFGKVLHYLRAVGSDEPDCADQTTLCERGYIQYKRAGRDWGCYVVTPIGLHIAGRIAHELAEQVSIHHVTFTTPGKRSLYGPSASCACGHWSSFASRKNVGRLERDAQAHLDAVAAGTWKKPRPIDEIIASSFPGKAKPSALPMERCEPGHGAAAPDVRVAVPIDPSMRPNN